MKGKRAIGALLAASSGLLIGGTDAAVANQDVVPSEDALDEHPRVLDGRIYAIEARAGQVIVGGEFTQIRGGADGSATIEQPRLFKYDEATGAIDSRFKPRINSAVDDVEWSADGRWIYVAGDFTGVNGRARHRLVRLDAATGQTDTGFNVSAPHRVRGIELRGNTLIVGGRFNTLNGVSRAGVAAVDATTGAVTDDWVVTPGDPREGTRVFVERIKMSDDGRWLVITGNFQTVNGVGRPQVAVVSLANGQQRLADWQTNLYAGDCNAANTNWWIRGVSISPDSRWFVVTTTGYHYGVNRMCDTAARWEFPPAMSGAGLTPTWASHTGGDTLWAGEITDAAVFVGGHQRWMNNSFPSPSADHDGPGAVPRQGIAALDPSTGLPLSWNPGKARGRGVEAFEATPDHLFIGSDTTAFGGEKHERLAVVPTTGGFANPLPQRVALPVDLNVVIRSSLYRVPFDGSSIGTRTPISGPGIDGIAWNGVRDGFVQHGQLVYFGGNEAYYRRPFDPARQFGTPTNLSRTVGYVDSDADITPYDQPAGIGDTRDAAYASGRVYYTRAGDNRLWWRYYALQSGVVGNQQHVAEGSDWSRTRALAVVGGHLYAAWDDGTLRRTPLAGRGAVSWRWTVVDVGNSGVDWANVTAMFATNR